MYGSWDMKRDGQNFLLFWTVFCPFNPLTIQKIKILKKWQTHLDISSFSCVPWMTTTWCMVPKIWSLTENFLSLSTVFCPFTPLRIQKIKILKNWKNAWRYYHFTHVHQKWQSYDVWFLRYEAWWTEFFVILDRFLPFYPCNNPKKLKFWKTEKKPWRYYHFTHVYHKWQSWCMVPDIWSVTDFLSFWTIFWPFTPWKPEKSKFCKNEKNTWGYHHFTDVY